MSKNSDSYRGFFKFGQGGENDRRRSKGYLKIIRKAGFPLIRLFQDALKFAAERCDYFLNLSQACLTKCFFTDIFLNRFS